MVNENETPDPNDPADIIRTAGGNLLETVNGVNALFVKLNATADDLRAMIQAATADFQKQTDATQEAADAAREAAIAAREATVIAREAGIINREAAIANREAAIENKEAAIADRESRAIIAAASKEQAENLRDLIGEALAAARVLAAEAKKDD